MGMGCKMSQSLIGSRETFTGKESTFPIPVNIRNIVQLDGNDSNSDITVNSNQFFPPALAPNANVRDKPDKITAALNLPTVATYNLRSLFHKMTYLKIRYVSKRLIVFSPTVFYALIANVAHSNRLNHLDQIMKNVTISYKIFIVNS